MPPHHRLQPSNPRHASRPSGDLIRSAALALRPLNFLGALLCALMAFISPAQGKTPMQLYVEAMQPGTNWGNTFDAVPNENSWGAPTTTQPMIQGLAAKGYKSLRLTVTWNNHMGPGPDYTIDPVYMNRIAEVTQWALDANLYVLVNLHHDGWVNEMGHDHDAVLDRFKKVWLQIATHFKDYPHKLSFESKNEPGFHDATGKDLPDAQMAILLDELNKEFHAVVRGTGGNNATRPLVLPSVYTRSDQPMLDSLKNTFTSLNDPNLIATIHYYGWYPFSVNLGGYTTFDDTSIYWVHEPLDAAYNTFVAAGIPIIVGEFSVLSGAQIQRGEQLKYHEYVQAYGRSKGMTMMLWDTGGIYGRNTQDWNNRDLGEILMQAVNGRALTAQSDMLFVKAGVPVTDRVINLKLNGNTLVSVEDNGVTLTPNSDYKVSGETLILKAHVLAKYATGAFGEKATLKLISNSGPAWKIFVRYFDTPVPGNVAATTGANFSIPVAFNGDLLATMEAKYADGSNVGGTSWTSFQQFGGDFAPNYGNNTITIRESFLRNALPNSIANLSFYFWSGKVLTYQLKVTPRSPTGGVEYVIYDDNLAPGWDDWTSWTTHDFGSTTEVYSGTKSFSFTPGAWGGVALQYGRSGQPPLDTSAFRTLTFWIHGGTTGGQNIGITPIRGGVWGQDGGMPSVQVPAPVANTWTKVEIPLSSFNIEGSPNINGFLFQHWTGEDRPTFYLDDIKLTTALTTAVMDVTGAPNLPASPFSITRSGFILNRRTNRMVQTVTVRNTSAETVVGPTYLVLDALSSNTTLANTIDIAPTGRPFVLVSAGDLAPQAQVVVSLEFTVPKVGGITYDARTYNGDIVP